MVYLGDVGIVRDRKGHPEKQEENQGQGFNGSNEEGNSKKKKKERSTIVNRCKRIKENKD